MAAAIGRDISLPFRRNRGKQYIRRLGEARQPLGRREVAQRGVQKRVEARRSNATGLEYPPYYFTSQHQPCLSLSSPYWTPWTVS